MASPYFITFSQNHGHIPDLFTRCQIPFPLNGRKSLIEELLAYSSYPPNPSNLTALTNTGESYHNIVDSTDDTNYYLIPNNIPKNKCFRIIAADNFNGDGTDNDRYLNITPQENEWIRKKIYYKIKRNGVVVATYDDLPFMTDLQSIEEAFNRGQLLLSNKYNIRLGDEIELYIVWEKTCQFEFQDDSVFGLISKYTPSVEAEEELANLLVNNLILFSDNQGNVSNDIDATEEEASLNDFWAYNGNITINITARSEILVTSGNITGRNAFAVWNKLYHGDGLRYYNAIINEAGSGMTEYEYIYRIENINPISHFSGHFKVEEGYKSTNAIISNSLIMLDGYEFEKCKLNRWTFKTANTIGTIKPNSNVSYWLPARLKNPQFKQTDSRYTKRDGTSVLLAAEFNEEYEVETDYIPYEWHKKIMRFLLCEDISVFNPEDNSNKAIFKTDNYQINWDNTIITDCGERLVQASFKVQVQGVDRNSIGL